MALSDALPHGVRCTRRASRCLQSVLAATVQPRRRGGARQRGQQAGRAVPWSVDDGRQQRREEQLCAPLRTRRSLALAARLDTGSTARVGSGREEDARTLVKCAAAGGWPRGSQRGASAVGCPLASRCHQPIPVRSLARTVAVPHHHDFTIILRGAPASLSHCCDALTLTTTSVFLPSR